MATFENRGARFFGETAVHHRRLKGGVSFTRLVHRSQRSSMSPRRSINTCLESFVDTAPFNSRVSGKRNTAEGCSRRILLGFAHFVPVLKFTGDSYQRRGVESQGFNPLYPTYDILATDTVCDYRQGGRSRRRGPEFPWISFKRDEQMVFSKIQPHVQREKEND